MSTVLDLTPDFSGSYTIRQASSGRFLDAYQTEDNNFSVVTRGEQGNDTQRWKLRVCGYAHTIRQVSTGRFLDAHQTERHDWSVVTREAQDNDSQIWLQTDRVGISLKFRFRQLSSGRFLDAYQTKSHDWSVVTRGAQNNNSQSWEDVNQPVVHNFVQASTKIGSPGLNLPPARFMDAWPNQAHDWSVVTREKQNNNSQEWMFNTLGFIYEIRQLSSIPDNSPSGGRFLDAYLDEPHDWSAVTREAQHNDTQRWIVMPATGGTWTMRQLSNRRFLDAHQTEDHNWSVVTRNNQNNETQRWLIAEA